MSSFHLGGVTRAAAVALLAAAAAWGLVPATAAAGTAPHSGGPAGAAVPEAAAPSATPARRVEVASSIRVQQAWIRWLPAGLPASGYVTLANDSNHAVVLIGATSRDYSKVQLHRSIAQDGLEKMVPVANITIPAHGTLDFTALGYHLMLMKPRVALSPGDRVPIELHFADGHSLLASFDVRPPATTAGHAGSSSSMPGIPGMPGMPHMQSMPDMPSVPATPP